MPHEFEKPPSRRRIVTAEEVRALSEGSFLDLPADAIVTDLAREWIAKNRIRVVAARAAPGPKPVQVAIGSDHAGFAMKQSLQPFLEQIGATYFDYGTHSTDSVDYPDFAHLVARAVALGHARRGIVVDGAGIGSAIAANKVPGIRAAPCHDEAAARNAREHNDANVLTLGSKFVPLESVRKVVAAFLTAEHTEPRHRARVAKIEAIEGRYYRTV